MKTDYKAKVAAVQEENKTTAKEVKERSNQQILLWKRKEQRLRNVQATKWEL